MPSPRRNCLPRQVGRTRTWWWPVGVSMLLVVGCGPLGGCHVPQGGPVARDPEAPAVTQGGEAVGHAPTVIVAPPPGPTPMLNDEARAARVFAQRAALGERAALLEDAEGQPFPSLAPLPG